jgi:2Fe-2S ferredoxin
MPCIRFKKNIPHVEVESGANLMEALLKAGLPVASSCHGDGVCGKCRVLIISGAENLSTVGAVEELAHDRLKWAREYRLSCQVQVLGDVVIDTSYW